LRIKRRLATCARRREAEAFGRNIEGLVACRIAHQNPDEYLLRWLERLDSKTLGKLAAWGILSAKRTSLAHPLKEHIADFEQSLKAKARTPQYIRQTVSAIREICTGCGFIFWYDIAANQVDYFLGEKREDRLVNRDGKQVRVKGLSARTYNRKLAAFKQICGWMVKEGRAVQSPVTHLDALNTRTDRRRIRRTLSPEQAIELLTATRNSDPIYSMKGHERALLYRLAIETGLRAGEIRNLSALSCNTESNKITLQAAHSKHRREDIITLKPDTAALLEDHIKNKTPNAPLFNLPCKENMILMLRKDLDKAEIPYQDAHGHYLDFHSLRHTTGTWLALSGAHPRVAQEIMRHSDINLTMNTYTHIQNDQIQEAVNRLPGLSFPPTAGGNATGTEG